MALRWGAAGRAHRALVFVAAAATACVMPLDDELDSTGQRTAAVEAHGDDTGDSPLARGTYRVMEHDLLVSDVDGIGEPPGSADSAPVPTQSSGWVIYLNRNGGDYDYGISNDSSKNLTTVPPSNAPTSTIPPWNVDEAGWAETTSCVRQLFSRFNIEFVDEPPSRTHIEAVIGGNPSDLFGTEEGAGGVSPFSKTCVSIPNSIVFVFPEQYGEGTTYNYQRICEVIAQEVAHSFGLDHEYLCEDPMSYLDTCGEKSFRNRSAPCGTYAERTCSEPDKYDCGRSEQNSVRLLTERVGLRASSETPIVSITYPEEEAVVPPGFNVFAEAVDNEAVVSVRLFVDGVEVAQDQVAPYELSAPMDLAEGSHELRVVASDGSSNEGSEAFQIIVDPDAAMAGGPPIVGSCQATGRGGGPWWLIALVALIARRRRR